MKVKVMFGHNVLYEAKDKEAAQKWIKKNIPAAMRQLIKVVE
jgi:hypothetical protein